MITRQPDSQTTGQLNFRDTLIQKADEIAHLVYPLTYKFPPEEKYALGDQIRRSIVSVPTNLTEGIARGGQKEIRQFANIAYWSLKEVKYLCGFAFKEKLIQENLYKIILPKFDELSRMLFTFLKILKK